jgi:hypothetical protein
MEQRIKVQKVWIEAEEWSTGWDPVDSNTDVMVHLDDGSCWIASFSSYKNIETLTRKNRRTGECLAGAYFWNSDMILIDETSRKRIEEVIEHLMKENKFSWIFREIEETLDLG